MIKEKTIHTKTVPSLYVALGWALAWTAAIEVVVSIVVIILFRMCGVIKMREPVTWGEIVTEEKAEKE